MKKALIGILAAVTVVAVGTVGNFAAGAIPPAGPAELGPASAGIWTRIMTASVISAAPMVRSASAKTEREDIIRMKTATASVTTGTVLHVPDRAEPSARDTAAGNRGR